MEDSPTHRILFVGQHRQFVGRLAAGRTSAALFLGVAMGPLLSDAGRLLGSQGSLDQSSHRQDDECACVT